MSAGHVPQFEARNREADVLHQSELDAYRLIYGPLGDPTTCASETCARTFWVQEGRSAKGQHRRTGVKFCSARCAATQTQRDRRRRDKETRHAA